MELNLDLALLLELLQWLGDSGNVDGCGLLFDKHLPLLLSAWHWRLQGTHPLRATLRGSVRDLLEEVKELI